MIITRSYLSFVLILIISLVIFCEFAIYYVTLIKCSWPILDKSTEDSSTSSDEEPLRVMFLADTHLLGSKKGHWFDKLRREWQMRRTFQTAMHLHSPDVIFVLAKKKKSYCHTFRTIIFRSLLEWCHEKIQSNGDLKVMSSHRKCLPTTLNYEPVTTVSTESVLTIKCDISGDLFDEGLWCSDSEFAAYVERFHSLFRTPEGSELFVVVGNHDIGFHYGISPYLKKRFTDAFKSPSVQMLSIKGVHFIMINSMAMEGDGCFLCRPAEIQLLSLSRKLKCSKTPSSCQEENDLSQYSRPVLLQHFPMYRESDEGCNEPDEAPEDEKRHKFRERWDCLSKESSDMLFEMLNPRVVITGHTHHGCRRHHKQYNAFEFTLSSFNWRNKDNPSYMLAVFTPNNYAFEKCNMPRESSVIFLYIIGALGIVVYIIASQRRHYWRIRVFKVH